MIILAESNYTEVGSQHVRYITGSMHIPMDMLMEQIGQNPTDRAVAVHCSRKINASYAVTILKMMG